MSMPGRDDKIHIVIREGRAPGSAQHGRARPDVVVEHNLISDRHGLAFFGKLGRRPDSRKLDLMRAAIAADRSSSLIYLRKSKRAFEAFGAPLRAVHTDQSAVRLLLVPEYYRDLAPNVSVWFEIGSFGRIPQRELNGLVLLSTGKSLLVTLRACRTSMMLVRRKADN